MKNIYFIIISVLFIIYITIEIKKKKLSIKESFWWVIGGIIMLVLAIFPKIFDSLAIWLGVSYPPTLFLTLCIVFILFLNFKNGKRIAEQNQKIIELEQHVALLESDKNEK